MDATSLDPVVLGGELTFAGTRVPVRSLLDHLDGVIPSSTSSRASLPCGVIK